MIAPIEEISAHIGDAVEPARFPKQILRWRNNRWAQAVGLHTFDNDAWLSHFARFTPLPDNLPRPLALRYHGHQFHVYNPDIGDGRGFLFAQCRDSRGRLLDLGTKGSGQTPWSRQGDGRLTLKGGVREILAAAYLEAFGVNTSKAFSLVETGEALYRGDEPSPTRSCVLTRLSHSHLRFGTFQRLAFHRDREAMVALIRHIAAHYYPEYAGLSLEDTIAALFAAMIQGSAKMIGEWMATGFVHGVMNTDNFNITGETFDFGPWRFLGQSDPDFTAAYFDHQGLYRFARQPVEGLWALCRLGEALGFIADTDSLSDALDAYEPAYHNHFAAHTLALLGVKAGLRIQDDLDFLRIFYDWMTQTGASWPRTFFDWFCGEASATRAAASPQAALYSAALFTPVREGLYARSPVRPRRLDHPYFQDSGPVDLVLETVETLWAPIAERDDWSLLTNHLDHIERARQAYDWTV